MVDPAKPDAKSAALQPFGLDKPAAIITVTVEEETKGKADAKRGANVGSMQRLYSEEFAPSCEFYTIAKSEVSEVSVVSTLRSDT